MTATSSASPKSTGGLSRWSRLRLFSSMARLLPYVWPYRRQVLLSFLFAGLVALFWSVNLSVAFPIVKVLIQGQTIDSYVQQEIESARKEIAKREAVLKRLDARELRLRDSAGGMDQAEEVDLLKDRSRQQAKMSAAAHKLLVMEWVRANVVSRLPGDQFDLLALIFGITLLALVLKGLCVFAQDVLIGNVVELTSMSIRKQCFRKVLLLDYQTLHLAGTSDLMSRFTHDLYLLGYSLRLVGGKVVREPLKAACCIIGALLVCWQLTVMSLLFVPLIGLVFHRIGRKLKLASRRMMESMSRIYKTLEETFDVLKVVIAFNGARRQRQRFHRENKEYFRKSQRIVRIDALTSPVTEVLGMFTALIALLPGAYLVLRHTTSIWGIRLTSQPLDVAELSLLYVLLAGVIDPVRKLSSTYAKLKRGSAAADRIFALMDKKPLVTEPATPLPLPRHRESIAFQRVEFQYVAHQEDGIARPAVLNDVSLTVQAGEVVVVVGENGSGKSTLVNLLPRFFDPDHGEVLIDGVDIRQVRLHDLREQIGIVTQETLLFDDTIYENIRYGKPEATRADVEEAARKAYVTDFLAQLPDGFETLVGEKGRRLSGGQRQRIALARAILRNPSILILDEATSAIDAQSEALIHESLRHFSQGRTTFLITHSVSQSILDFVTRIVVMEEGRLVASGTHGQLLAECPVYQRLFRSQITRQTTDRADEPARPPSSGAEVRRVDSPGSCVPAAEHADSGQTDSAKADSSRPHILSLPTSRAGKTDRKQSGSG